MSERLSRYPVHASRRSEQDTTIMSRIQLRRTVRQALRQTSGPFLEVGGPTPRGYVTIDRMRFPHGLTISNFEPTEGASDIEDVRGLTYPNASLGGILMSGLTRVPEEIARARHQDGIPVAFRPHLLDDLGNIFGLIVRGNEGDYSKWNDPTVMNFSQRLALLREARRTIEPGGLFIANILGGGEIRLLEEQLGFEQLVTTVKEVDRGMPKYNIGEFVFRLANLDTPAGQLIETSPSPFNGVKKEV